MSDSDTDMPMHPFIDEIIQLISLIKQNKLFKTIFIIDEFEDMKQYIDKFLLIYSNSIVKKVLCNDISTFLDKVQKVIISFIKYVEYINTKSTCSKIVLHFINDLQIFISNFTILMISCTDILEKIKRMYKKDVEKKYINKVLNQFYLEISIFEYANNIKSTDQLPYYQISNLPVYKYLHDQVYTSINKFMNIIGPHGSGKTSLIPLFLANRSLGYTIKSQFIIVIENDISIIQDLKKLYKQINKNKNTYMKNCKDCLLITSSIEKFYEKSEKKSEPTIIAILTPIEGIQLLQKMIPNPKKDITFLKKSSFVIDNINQRKPETDILAANILNNVFNIDLVKERAKLVLLGTYSDSRFLTICGSHCDTFEVPIVTKNTKINVINCQNSIEIRKIAMVSEMKNFFDSWIKNDDINIGSVIVFVPNVKTGRSLAKNLYKVYQNNSLKVIPLQTKIKKGESITNFNERLLIDINKSLIERSENPEETALKTSDIINDDTIFILPIDFTGNLSEEVKQLAQISLPPPILEKKLVRVIISTNQNDHIIKTPDVTVIFDSGLTEIEYYDVKKCASVFKTEQLQDHDINQRNALMEDNERNVHILFAIQNHRANEVVPLIKRCDLIQSILQLRSIDINFELQRNLPDEPVYDIVENRMSIMRKLNLIDIEDDELTELGRKVSKFSIVSTHLAIATVKFKKNQEFAFLLSLIIDKSIELIDNCQASLLCDHFCRESDVVTILDTILALNTNDHNEIKNEDEVDFENSGISMSALELFYIAMINVFNFKNREKGREAVINSIIWSKEQPGGTIAMVDEFVSLFDKYDFLNIRRATFEYISGVGSQSIPTIVYKANDVLKFDQSNKALIKFSQRPGHNGLQSPGNIIALSLQIQEAVELNCGILLHRDPSPEEVNLGVVSQEVKSFLNSCFFVALFESYWNGNPIINDLIPVYHSNKPKKETGFLLHINECNKKTYISYCPKTPKVHDEMNKSIPFLSSLMPFVPRSVIAKSEVPVCAVEIISYGTSREYETHVFLIDQPEKPKPIAYQLNKQLLEYAGNKIDELRKTTPKIRFSITGESVYYNFTNKRQVEAGFSYPNVNPNIKSVFDSIQSSHLVLLIDSDYKDLPGVASIPWILNDKSDKNKIKNDDNNVINMMIDVSTKIMNGLGFAQRSSDIFFIALSNGYPSAKKDEIPDSIQAQIGFDESDQGAIKQGIHQLIHHITQKSIRNDIIKSPILLKNLNSTNHCTLYTTKKSQLNACQQIKTIISNNLGFNELDISFIGPSMICLSIDDLDSKRTQHPQPDNMWDDSYHPCEIDKQISDVLISNSFPVTSVVHEPSVELTVYHLPHFEINKKEFEKKVNEIADQFGFINYFKPRYKKNSHTSQADSSILGEMTIGLIGKNCCIGCATCISKKFPVFSADAYDLDNAITTMAMTSMRSIYELDPSHGEIPKISSIEKIIHFPPCEIEAMKELVQHNKKLKFDENYHVLIIKSDDYEEAIRKMQQVRQEKMETTCFLSCEMDEPELLPQFLYVNEEDGSVKQLGICKNCARDLLQNYDDIRFIYNPVKHLIDQDRLMQIPMRIKGFDLVPNNKNSKGEWWPQIPLGQMAWALMSDPSDELTSYVKAWFTIVIEYSIQISDYFMFCPDHPQIPIIRLGNNKTVKCPVCDMIYCNDCDSWHKMSDECIKGLEKYGVKRCPKCHRPTFKYDGCDHMTCNKCKCEWNYRTGKKW